MYRTLYVVVTVVCVRRMHNDDRVSSTSVRLLNIKNSMVKVTNTASRYMVMVVSCTSIIKEIHKFVDHFMLECQPTQTSNWIFNCNANSS